MLEREQGCELGPHNKLGRVDYPTATFDEVCFDSQAANRSFATIGGVNYAYSADNRIAEKHVYASDVRNVFLLSAGLN
jgi:hypothetical protein